MSKSHLCLRPRPIALVGVVTLSSLMCGCAAINRIANIGEQPKLSTIDNPTTKPGYKPVQMPMPTPQPATYNPNSLWRTGSRAFFKDQRARQVGDILTVMVNITDKAILQNETQRSRSNTEDSGITDFLGAHTQTPSAALPGRLLTDDSNMSNDGKGSINRQEALQTNVAAVVTQVLPNGNLVVEGKAADPRQLRDPRAHRRRHRAAGGHPERQHHRFEQDRRGPHRLWRPRPDHGRAAAALRESVDGCGAAVLMPGIRDQKSGTSKWNADPTPDF